MPRSYFQNAISHPQACILAISEAMRSPKLGQVDHIIGTGVSGTLLLVPVSIETGIPYLVARKNCFGSHSPRRIEGLTAGNIVGRYVIIDDFISTGNTIDSVKQEVASQCSSAKCAGIILYEESRHYYSRDLVPVIGVSAEVIRINGTINGTDDSRKAHDYAKV